MKSLENDPFKLIEQGKYSGTMETFSRFDLGDLISCS